MSIELRQALEKVQRIADTIITPNAAQWDANAQWPEQAIRALQKEGLAGLMVPRHYGGLEQGMSALIQVCEILGRADASTALCFGMHCVATACLVAKVNADHAERFLVPIAKGEHFTTLALSEPGTGSHFYLPEVTLSPVGESYRVNGTKCFVTNGGHADSYVLSAVDNREQAPLGHFSMLLLPADNAGIKWGAPWSGWGMRGNSSRTMRLDDVEVPIANRMGDEGEQIWFVFNVVAPYFLIAMAGTYLGIARHALDETVSHLKARRYSHTGAPLAELEVLQHSLGTVWAEFERTRRLCYWAARMGDNADPEALPALCAAKAEVGHAVINIVNRCMTLVGGVAYRDGSILQQLMRDGRAAHVMSPTTDMLYTWVGRALLDLPLLGD